MSTFEIGDIVEIGELHGWREVVGVIHDTERLFVSIGPDWEQQEFPFAAVVAQYRRLDAAIATGTALLPARSHTQQDAMCPDVCPNCGWTAEDDF